MNTQQADPALVPLDQRFLSGIDSSTTHSLMVSHNLRIWRDERLGQLWRATYNDGYGETVISFPDTAALEDFIAEHLGLHLLEDVSDGEIDMLYYS